MVFSLLVRAEELTGPQLSAELRRGGYVLYIRHTSTDFSKNDANMTSYEDCASQRNLTDKGRDEARAVGAHIKRLGIPIGRIFASPFCRTVETAMLAFGKAEKTQDVRGGPVRTDDPKRYDPLKRLLAARPAKGTNNVVSSHGNPYFALFGAPYLAEGEVAVIRSRGKARSETVARVLLGDWQTLAAMGEPLIETLQTRAQAAPAPELRHALRSCRHVRRFDCAYPGQAARSGVACANARREALARDAFARDLPAVKIPGRAVLEGQPGPVQIAQRLRLGSAQRAGFVVVGG